MRSCSAASQDRVTTMDASVETTAQLKRTQLPASKNASTSKHESSPVFTKEKFKAERKLVRSLRSKRAQIKQRAELCQLTRSKNAVGERRNCDVDRVAVVANNKSNKLLNLELRCDDRERYDVNRTPRV